MIFLEKLDKLMLFFILIEYASCRSHKNNCDVEFSEMKTKIVKMSNT